MSETQIAEALRASLVTHGVTPPPVEVDQAPDIKPGLYKGVSFEEYASWPLVHHSDLVVFNRTPAHAREAMLHPREATKAMDFGRAFHSAILEPADFAKSYVKSLAIGPDGRKLDRRFKDHKAAWEDFDAENATKTILDGDDWNTLIGMQKRMWAHPTAKEILSAPGHSEVCIVWKDEETELTLKARIDRICVYGGYPCLVDLKTTDNDASERAFQNTMAKYRYHQQAATYLAGMEALFPGPYRQFWFVVQEKERPYEPACYRVDDAIAIPTGMKQFRRCLRTLKECVETGVWPGHGNGGGEVTLPNYALEPEDQHG